MQRTLLAPLALFLAPAVLAQDWPHWRGPAYDGSAAATGLPKQVGKDTHVKWKSALPGPGASTPIVVGERVYLSAVDRDAQELLALCFDRETGALRWRKAAGSGYVPANASSKTALHDRSNYASPSAVADAERVVFFFGNGDLVCYDPEGQEQWRRNLQKDLGDFAFQWTFSASPTLWDGRLFLQVLQRDTPVSGRGKEGAPSLLLALDPRTGETQYAHERPSSARKESLESYATPIPYVGADGRKELLVAGGDVLTGHDPATGKELWRWGTWNPDHREEWWRLVPSPVVGAGVALACGPKKAPVFAVKLGGEGELASAEALAWQSGGRRNPITTDVPTPLFYDGRFYVLSDLFEVLTCVDPESGAARWSLELPGRSKWRASPTGADGRLWCLNHAGDLVVVDASSGELLHTAALGEEDDDAIRSSVVVAHGCVFVRTNTTLFCFSE
jgi:outer membrane protein assembly factor BamB